MIILNGLLKNFKTENLPQAHFDSIIPLETLSYRTTQGYKDIYKKVHFNIVSISEKLGSNPNAQQQIK